MKTLRIVAGLLLAVGLIGCASDVPKGTRNAEVAREITVIDPPENGFFSKQLDYHGIPIKAHAVVSDAALLGARERLDRMLGKLPGIRAKLAEHRVRLHIIGKDQVTTDLPEWRHDKGKPLAEYNGLTRDERTRGMGGREVSCGEENLLRLRKDRYRGRDICVHEFAHAIQGYGMTDAERERFERQYKASLEKGRWLGSYAGSNVHEYFAELSMWYFGTRGDLKMSGPKPKDGPEGLRKYDPEAFELFDRFYRGEAL
jgi:hypothetical protein